MTWERGVSVVGRKQIISRVTFKQMGFFPLCFLGLRSVSGGCKTGVVKPKRASKSYANRGLLPGEGKTGKCIIIISCLF